MAHKSTASEIEERVTHVQKLLLSGLTRKAILKDKECQSWGIQSRQMDTYIALAHETITEINNTSRESNMAMITTNLWELYRATKGTGDIGEAHKILNSIAKLKGLDETTVNHILKDDSLVGLSDDEFRALRDATLDETH